VKIKITYVRKKCALSRRDDRISSLTKKPPRGGIPLLENTIKEKIIARSGFDALSEPKWLRCVF
jgi:hypothetical protein